MYAIVPVYNASFESEDRIINPSHIEEVRPNANVPVDPGAVDTEAVLVRFYSGAEIIVLLNMSTMATRLQAITGLVDNFGTLV
jgi:hypothetical protein